VGFNDRVAFDGLKGKVITRIDYQQGRDPILFFTTTTGNYKMYHDQDCCENVYLEDVVGNLDDLLNTEILLAEEVVSGKPDKVARKDRATAYKKEVADAQLLGRRPFYKNFKEFCNYRYESETWTFYKLATIKGSVTLRWYGSSSGNYSESVSFEKCGTLG
jgi:hypothetical protein